MSEPDNITPEDERRGEELQEYDDPDGYEADRAARRYEDWMLGDK